MSNHSGVGASISKAIRGEFTPHVGAQVLFPTPRGYRAGTIVAKGLQNGTWKLEDRKGATWYVGSLGLLPAAVLSEGEPAER